MPTLFLLFELVLKHWLSQWDPSGTSVGNKGIEIGSVSKHLGMVPSPTPAVTNISVSPESQLH